MFLKLFPRYAGRARRGATVAGDNLRGTAVVVENACAFYLFIRAESGTTARGGNSSDGPGSRISAKREATYCRDRMAPDCPIRHPVFQIVAPQRRVRFSARLAGFCRVGVTRDALEGLKRPHFRYWSLISIFECHVCAKGRERVADRARAASEKRPPEGSRIKARATAA